MPSEEGTKIPSLGKAVAKLNKLTAAGIQYFLIWFGYFADVHRSIQQSQSPCSAVFIIVYNKVSIAIATAINADPP
jgi:hypothetical protein